MRSIIVRIVATLFLFYNLTSAQDGTPCNNPRGARGNCQNIKSCEPLLTILRQYGNAAGDFLRQSVCGYDDRDPLVCCPFDESNERNDNGGINNKNNNNNNNNNDNVANNNNNSGGQKNSAYGPLLAPVCGTTDKKFTRVVGGVPTELGAWPWAAILGYRSTRNPNKPRWLCGGSLISARHVLTAGHCVHEHNDLFLVRLGDLDLESDNDGASPIDVLIEKRTVHPRYSPTTYVNDIAVLRLQKEVQFTPLIQPVCLPVVDPIREKDLVGKYPFLIGWGSVSFNGPSSSVLQQLQVPVQSQERCKDAFKKFAIATIDERVICAGFAQGGKDACKGDSGGPLMFPIRKTFYVVGVVSYGFKCAEPGYPGVYTKVTAFLDFVVPLLN